MAEGGALRFRVVSWNLDSRPTGRLDAKVELLRQLRPDLALLQELRRPVFRAVLLHPFAYERIREQPRAFSWGVLSTDLSTPRGSNYRLGCAVLGSQATTLLDARLLDDAAFEVDEPTRLGFLRRALSVRVAIAGAGTLTACSLHSHNATDGPGAQLQAAFLRGVAGWLAAQSPPVAVGMDSPIPAAAPPDRCPAPLDRASMLQARLGEDALPSLRPCHDHIWATADLEPLEVRYLHDEADAAGSDHPLVLADFAVSVSQETPASP